MCSHQILCSVLDGGLSVVRLGPRLARGISMGQEPQTIYSEYR